MTSGACQSLKQPDNVIQCTRKLRKVEGADKAMGLEVPMAQHIKQYSENRENGERPLPADTGHCAKVRSDLAPPAGY